MPVRFAHISDSHIGPDYDHRLYDTRTAPRLQRLVQRLNAMQHELDFVVHTGDVTSDPDTASTRLAAQILGALEVPLYLVLGNHDSAMELRRVFPWPPPNADALPGERYSYTFCRNEHRFLVLDAVASPDMDPQGQLDATQLQAVDTCLARWPEPLTVFIHFPAMDLDCEWIDRQMLIVNGAAPPEISSAARTDSWRVFRPRTPCRPGRKKQRLLLLRS